MNSPSGFNMPSCLVIPSASGSISNCVQMQLPSTGVIIGVIIVSWILFMAVAYAIYYFVNAVSPGVRLNYWIILLILVLSGIIVSLLFR